MFGTRAKGKMRNKNRRHSNRRRLMAEPLEDRRMLAKLLTILVDQGGSFQNSDPIGLMQGTLYDSPTRNIAAFYTQSSGGQFTWEPAVAFNGGVIGPFSIPSPSTDLANSVITSQQYERIIRSESIVAASDAGFDFSVFDSDGNGIVNNNELQIMIVINGQASGAVRSYSPVSVEGGESNVTVQGTMASVGENTTFATVAHELAHLIGADDLYGEPTGCPNGQMTLMSCTVGVTSIFDFDPWHKEFFGWEQYPSFDLANPGTRILKDTGTSPTDSGFILYDSRSSLNDRLYVELRPSGQSYDQPAGVSEGVAVWYVRENPDGSLAKMNRTGNEHRINFVLGSSSAGGHINLNNSFNVANTWQDGFYTMEWLDGSTVDTVFEVDRQFNGTRYEFSWGIQEDVLEQNDSVEAALNLGNSDQSWKNLTIDAPDDDDYYRFTAAADGLLSVDIEFLHDFGDLNVWLFDSSGSILRSSTSASDNEAVSLPVVSGESYIIRVFGRLNATHPEYHLNIDGPSIAEDRFESNESIANAANLASEDQTWNKLTIHTHDDKDFFSYTAPASGQLTVDVTFDQADGDLDLDLLDSSANVLVQSTSSSDDEQVVWTVTAGETYFIHAYGYFSATNSNYTLGINGPEPVLPDLRAFAIDADFNGDDQVAAGDSIEVFFDYDNVFGSAATGDSYDIGFYLSRDSIIDPADDVLLRIADGTDLIPHGFFNDTITITLPANGDAAWAGSGDYYIGMYLDDTFRLSELSESNNSLSDLISVVVYAAGDFDRNGALDVNDIDALVQTIASGTNTRRFDLNDDFLVNHSDLNEWLVLGGAANPSVTGGNPFLRGDANLDGQVDSTDLGLLLNSFGANEQRWSNGNFNSDQVVDSTDLGLLLNNFGQTSFPVAARLQVRVNESVLRTDSGGRAAGLKSLNLGGEAVIDELFGSLSASFAPNLGRIEIPL